MPVLSATDYLQQDTALSPCNAVIGTDGFLLRAVRERIVNTFTAAFGEPDLVTVSLEEDSLAAALDAARYHSLFAGRRLVFADFKGKILAGQQDPLLAYLDKPAKSGILILVAAGMDRSLKLHKAMLKKGTRIDCETPKPAQLVSWLNSLARDEQKKLQPEAAEALVQSAGNSMEQLLSEFTKIVTYIGEERAITLDHIRLLVEDQGSPQVWTFLDKVSAGDTADALAMLNQLLRHTPAPVLVGGLRTEIERLWVVSDGMDAGLSPKAACDHAKVMPFKANATAVVARALPTPMIAQFHRELVELDIASKSGGVDRDHQRELEAAVVAITRRIRQSRAAVSARGGRR